MVTTLTKKMIHANSAIKTVTKLAQISLAAPFEKKLTEISTANFLDNPVVSNNDWEEENSAQFKKNHDGLDLAYDKKMVGKPSRQMD